MYEKKFPLYVLDDGEYDFPYRVQDYPLLILIGLDQKYDLYKGYLFAQNYLLNHDIKNFSENEFEQFIKNLHKIVAKHLIPATSCQFLSGEYALVTPVIEKNLPYKGDKLSSVVNSFSLSQEDIVIVDKICGNGSAQEYQSFLSILKEEIKRNARPETLKDLYLNDKLSLLEWVEKLGLKDHPGYAIHLKFYKECTHPQSVEKVMQVFCREIIAMIQSNEDPVKIAAKALLLGEIHPFQNGNGRVARLLVNCILFSYNLTRLALAKNKQVFYQEFESCADDIEMVYNLLREKIQKQKAINDTGDSNPQFLHENALMGKSEHGLTGVFRKSGCDVFENEKGDIYNMASLVVRDKFEYRPELPVSEEKQKSMMQEIEQNFEIRFLTARINAPWCFKKAEFYESQREINIAGYCYYRAYEFYLEENNTDFALKSLMKAISLYCKGSFFDGVYDLCHEAMVLAKGMNDEKSITNLENYLENLSFVKDYRLKTYNIEIHDPEIEKGYLKKEIHQLNKEGKQAYKKRQYSKAIELFEESNKISKIYTEKYFEEMLSILSQNYFGMACCYKGIALQEKNNIFRSGDSYIKENHQKAICHLIMSHKTHPNSNAENELNKYKQQLEYKEYIDQAESQNEKEQMPALGNLKL